MFSLLILIQNNACRRLDGIKSGDFTQYETCKLWHMWCCIYFKTNIPLFTFWTISHHGIPACYWNPSLWEAGICLSARSRLISTSSKQWYWPSYPEYSASRTRGVNRLQSWRFQLKLQQTVHQRPVKCKLYKYNYESMSVWDQRTFMNATKGSMHGCLDKMTDDISRSNAFSIEKVSSIQIGINIYIYDNR